MRGTKKTYQPPSLKRAGSFEELTRSSKDWDGLMIFGLTGGAANLNALS